MSFLGTGGQEASIFAHQLYQLYSLFSESKGWEVDILDISSPVKNQVREVVAKIQGNGCYNTFLQEVGVHRVQRVPETDSQGRTHTSTVTVAVFPHDAETEVVIDERDVRMDVFRSSAPGGQNVNKTNSAVRLVHIPTGITVSMQDERSQIQNKVKAFKILAHRLRNKTQTDKADALKSARSEQVHLI